MAREICPLCKKGVLTGKPSCTIVNGTAFHTKCVKKQRQDTKKIELKQGKEAILNAVLFKMKEQNPEIDKLTEEQTRLICIQIAKLAQQGYSYDVQLEAFKHYFDKGKEFKGYGIMLYVIEKEVAEMEKEKKFNKIINNNSSLSIKEMLDKQR